MIAQPLLSDAATPLPPGMEPLRARCHATEGAFFIETEHHMLAYLPGKKRLVVTFDNLASDRDVEARQPFACQLVQRKGWAILGVMVKRKDWFQCPHLKTALLGLQSAGLFAGYDNVSMYGASMGGFGAAVFAPLAPGCTVLAFAPQSTLDGKVVPFERRYRYGRGLGDWSAPFNDAAVGVQSAGCAYLIYDPVVEGDKLHALRMVGEGVTLLPVPHFSHKIPPMLMRMGVLKEVAVLGMKGALDPLTFRRLMRSRRGAVPYLLNLLESALAKGHVSMAERAAKRALTLVPNWKLRKMLTEIKRG
ncbi:hypothetical protein ACEN2J_04385 [Pseudorhodobacter sp. W20_MBD10_FR17]|uniref:hypothetical protein n=1 Tax=Pseudorhodobacter sp. W20_MBD10_FR17 TaxID=3240266 RepID=UPI003F94EB39